ncbi:MAG: DUF952 domain-containing protein [Cyanobacteriota bacterium]
MSSNSVLYSFRRCPYAIRARLALAAAGIPVEVREVALLAKPPELLEASAKGTVPVLLRPTGETLSESQDILVWALGRRPGGTEAAKALREGDAAFLLAECDGAFKHHLDGFRYGGTEPADSRGSSRRIGSPEHTDADSEPNRRDAHRKAALAILRRWSSWLDGLVAAGTSRGHSGSPDQAGRSGGTGDGSRGGRAGPLEGAGGFAGCDGSGPVWLEPLGWAVLPFVRQFRLTDPEGFAQESGLAQLRRQLAAFEASAAFAQVMAPPWAWRQPWRSPRWLYHLALAEEWREARRQGVYTRSTRGRSLADVGFIHASWSHQLTPTWQRFYADLPDLRLLSIDPERLAAAAIPVREEPSPPSEERFPHIYGALPIEAVRLAQRWEPPAEPPAP